MTEDHSPYYIIDDGVLKQCDPDEWRDYFRSNKRYIEFNKIVVKKDVRASEIIFKSQMVVKEPSILIYTIFTGIEHGFNKKKKPFVFETHVFNFTKNDKYNFLTSFIFRDVNQKDAFNTNHHIIDSLLYLIKNNDLTKNKFLKEMNSNKVFLRNEN